ncbi:unnamed protein product [Rhizophagus irregularis]|nr:unnamed protein product [Rhizophagus irregularis]
MSTSESYPGQNALISYIKERNNRVSYRAFLNSHRDIIVTSIATSIATSTSDNLNEYDNLWKARFLHEGKDIANLKDKVKLERLQRKKDLQEYWQEIIKECEKENLIPAITATTPDKDLSKFSHKKTKNIKLTNFCYDILYELETKSNTHPFYKYDENKASNKIINHPMDLFTINSKLKNDKYTSIKDFEKDMHLIFHNCYTYNDRGSEIYNLGEELESVFNKIWVEKVIFQVGQKEKLKRVRDTDDSSTELVSKQIQILEQNKDKLVYKQIINDTLLVATAYENLVAGNIIPFIKILKKFLQTRSQMSLSSADEPVLQAIVESLLPLKYHIPELSLVMNGKMLKGFGRFGYSDIFVLKGIGDSNVSLELKYISLVGLVTNKVGANDLEILDKILEKEDEELLLKRLYTYWSKEHKKTKQTTIGEVMNNGINQLKSYMDVISKGKTIDYSSSGIFDKRVKIINQILIN